MLLKNDVFNSTSKNPAGMPAFLKAETQIEFFALPRLFLYSKTAAVTKTNAMLMI